MKIFFIFQINKFNYLSWLFYFGYREFLIIEYYENFNINKFINNKKKQLQVRLFKIRLYKGNYDC